MRRNYLLDSLLFLVSLLLTMTGGVIWVRRNRCGNGTPQRHTTASLDTEGWKACHRISALAFIAGLVVHLFWHWNWITQQTSQVWHREKDSI